MDRFLNKEVCVRVNRKQTTEFLQLCEELGLSWQSGHTPTGYEKHMIFSSNRVTIGLIGNGGTLLYDRYGYSRFEGKPAIDYEELVLPGNEASKPVPFDLSKIYG